MSAATLKRGAAPKRAPRRKATPRASTIALPVAPARLRRWLAVGGVALLTVAAAVGLWIAGLPQRWADDSVRATAAAGFGVRHVELAGVRNADKLAIYAAALDGPTDAMLAVDLDRIRARLRAQPWIADASVRRRLPDTLVITVVERRPAALWQHRRRLALIDSTGAVLERDRLDRFAALPLVVGPEANRHAGLLFGQLRAQPTLAGEVDAATFVGRRRWDLRFRSGETLALPEGDTAAAAALATFARLERQDGMLGKGFARFDMRLPGQLTVRVTTTPGAKVPAPAAGVTT